MWRTVAFDWKSQLCEPAGDDTPDPGFKRDKEMYHQASSRPGANVPHAVITHNQLKFSTLDFVW